MKNEQYIDEFLPFLGQIVRLTTEGHVLPLHGRLIALSRQFLTFERRDGRRTLVRRSGVLTIEPIRNQHQEAV